MSVLDVADVAVRYGNVKAVDGVSFRVEAGSIFGVIGPNGAGKTSLIDALTGFAPLAAGRVHLRGQDVSRQAPYLRARAGLARSWQSGELFEDLSVLENLLGAADTPPWWAMLLDALRPGRRVANDALARRAMDELGLAAVADRLVSEIPQDKRKLVSIARALASDPAVVLMDEPAAGLNPEETAALGGQLRQTAERGLGVLLIDHDMELVLSVCDRILVLDFGRPIAEGTPQQIVGDANVVAAYLGSSGAPADDADARAEATA